ncbi:MAG: TRAP transporter small permease subunit [Roseobacter sp.]
MIWTLKFADGVDRITNMAARVASALLLAMIALVAFNVFGRYIIGTAPVWMQELEWHLMPPIALLGVSVLMKEGGHVRVDMLYDRFSPRMRIIVDLISMLCGAAVAALLIKYSLGFVNSALSIFEGSPDPGGLPARWLLKGFLLVGFALLSLQCLANAARHAEQLMTLNKEDRNA